MSDCFEAQPAEPSKSAQAVLEASGGRSAGARGIDALPARRLPSRAAHCTRGAFGGASGASLPASSLGRAALTGFMRSTSSQPGLPSRRGLGRCG
jgi:hypothetical protein